MMKEKFQSIFKEHQKVFDATFGASEPLEVLEQMSREILKAFKSGHKILICGNGGSAADAQHIAAEFIGRFKRERRSLPAIALTTDTSALTAIANDYDYSQVFSRQVEGLGQKGDLLIAISTSGNSSNVLKAAEQAAKLGMVILGFAGVSGGKLKDVSTLCFKAQSKNTAHIQEMHIAALHAISEVVEDVFFGS